MKNTDVRLQIYIDRLYQEWITHVKIIVGVDFDSAISPYGTLSNQHDVDRTINADVA